MAPGAARADNSGASDACVALLDVLQFLPPPNTERPLALEVLADTDWESGSGTVLQSSSQAMHLGAEVRLFLGIPGSGFELLVDGDWLAPVLGSGGALRAGFGFDATWDLGGLDFYLLATDGLYATGDGLTAPRSLAVLPEWRFGTGLRIPIPGGALIAEADSSALGWLGQAGGPVVGFRFGFAFGAPAPPPCGGFRRPGCRDRSDGSLPPPPPPPSPPSPPPRQ